MTNTSEDTEQELDARKAHRRLLCFSLGMNVAFIVSNLFALWFAR